MTYTMTLKIINVNMIIAALTNSTYRSSFRGISNTVLGYIEGKRWERLVGLWRRVGLWRIVVMVSSEVLKGMDNFVQLGKS